MANEVKDFLKSLGITALCALLVFCLYSCQQNSTVYVSNYGKIHSSSKCSGMRYYTKMKYADAVEAGYSKCKNCY